MDFFPLPFLQNIMDLINNDLHTQTQMYDLRFLLFKSRKWVEFSPKCRILAFIPQRC